MSLKKEWRWSRSWVAAQHFPLAFLSIVRWAEYIGPVCEESDKKEEMDGKGSKTRSLKALSTHCTTSWVLQVSVSPFSAFGAGTSYCPCPISQFSQADEEEHFNSTLVMRRILKLAFLNAIQRRWAQEQSCPVSSCFSHRACMSLPVIGIFGNIRRTSKCLSRPLPITFTCCNSPLQSKLIRFILRLLQRSSQLPAFRTLKKSQLGWDDWTVWHTILV